MGVPTHVLQFGGHSSVSEISSHRDISVFSDLLKRFNGTDRFALTVWALPTGMDYAEAVKAGYDGREYIQAMGRCDELTVEVCQPGGTKWGVDWVRYVVGHSHEGDAVLDVPIVLPYSTEMRSHAEIFEADEAAELFYSYYKTGEIPPGYALRPEQGFTRAGGNVDLRDQVTPPQ